ncbi:MAG: hypothetical protein ABR94_09005 [Sphingobacteriales bacterium BACL12 MAG-120802-bin5]|jgi:O-antigen ligase|nr:MAG: hypothetical protein ABR94_09005 [Sphingobacteriales bacterium BACL12 MAG-120802-bin5]
MSWKELRTLLHRIFYVLFIFFLIAAVACLPFHKVFAVFPLGLAGIAGLTSVLLDYPWRHLRQSIPVLTGALLYVAALLAWWVSTDKATAADDLRVKLPLLIMPVIFTLVRPLKEQEWKLLLWLFVIACLAFIGTAIGIASWKWLTTGYNAFNYKRLVAFTIIHPAYLGMFINFAICILLTGWLGYKGSIRASTTFTFLAVAVFFIFLMMLTAKNAVLFALIAALVTAYIYARRTGQLVRAAWISSAALIIFIVFLLVNPYTRERFSMLYRFNDVSYDNSVNSREETWRSATQLMQTMPWYGVGSGEVQTLLNERHTANSFELGVEEQHNAHNQYFQTLLESGIPGLLLLLIVLGYGFYSARRSRQSLYTAFLLLFCFSILTESMLETQNGILFFSVFNALFLMRRAAQA